MAGLHHWLDGRESVWTPGVGDLQGGLACCNSWGRKEADTTERLNWTELNAEKADVERFYEDPQDLLELTPKKYVIFILGDWVQK